MDYIFFQPGRVNSLAILFENSKEKKEFFSQLDENTQQFMLCHSEEFHSSQEFSELKNSL